MARTAFLAKSFQNSEYFHHIWKLFGWRWQEAREHMILLEALQAMWSFQ